VPKLTNESGGITTAKPIWNANQLGLESITGCHIHICHRYLLLLLTPNADIHFTDPQSMEDLVEG